MRPLTLAGLGVVLAGTVLAVPVAHAEERSCRGSLGAVTVDNLRVPSGATCTLHGTTVQGTVKVERGGQLTATSIRAVGNIQAEGHAAVAVADSTIVDGNLQCKENVPAPAGSGNVVGGNKEDQCRRL